MFSSKKVIIGGEEFKTNQLNINDLSLTELELLFVILKNADLKGHQVEQFYNMVLKLQNQYINQQSLNK